MQASHRVARRSAVRNTGILRAALPAQPAPVQLLGTQQGSTAAQAVMGSIGYIAGPYTGAVPPFAPVLRSHQNVQSGLQGLMAALDQLPATTAPAAMPSQGVPQGMPQGYVAPQYTGGYAPGGHHHRLRYICHLLRFRYDGY
jgi:hypothetical protein